MGVIENFDELQELWEWVVGNTPETSLKAQICGISSYSKAFSYCFGIHLAATLLQSSDNLSNTLQVTQLSGVDAQRISHNIQSTLESLRNAENFKLFYKKAKKFAKAHCQKLLVHVTEPMNDYRKLLQYNHSWSSLNSSGRLQTEIF